MRTIWRVPRNDAELSSPSKPQAQPNGPSSVTARYGGDVVLRFNLSSAVEAKAMTDAVNVLFLDVWESTANWVDIRLSKETVPLLLGLLPAELQKSHTPLMHDLAQTIFASYPAPAPLNPLPTVPRGSQPFTHQVRKTAQDADFFFRNYQPLSVILPWMRLLRSMFPTHVRLISVGSSYEGREIRALRVGVHPTNSEKPSERRKTIVITGGAHAREWISTSTVNYVAYSFITAYGRDRHITMLLEKFDFVFVPTINPDGYAYTWESDRLWRKNRQQTALRFCKGLDLDRAFGFQWDATAAANDNPCSESFSGENPFEAIEARRFADWARNETSTNNVEFVGFLDLHSYSQQILYPFSYSCERPPTNLEDLEELAIGLSKAIRLTHGEHYSITSACEAGGAGLDHASTMSKSSDSPRIETGGGSALDWFYHELHIAHSYQIKLRDTGNYGFLLPSEYIVPTGKEIFNAVRYFADFLSGNIGLNEEKRPDLSSQAKLSHLVETDEAGINTQDTRQSGNDGFSKPLQWSPPMDLRRRRR